MNSDYSNEITKILTDYNERQCRKTSPYLVNKVQILLRSVLNKSNILIIGPSSIGKSTLIKLSAHIYNQLMSNFLKNYPDFKFNSK